MGFAFSVHRETWLSHVAGNVSLAVPVPIPDANPVAKVEAIHEDVFMFA